MQPQGKYAVLILIAKLKLSVHFARRNLMPVFFCAIGWLISSSIAIGQTEINSATRIAKLIDGEAVAVIHINDFPSLLDHIVSHPAFKNQGFLRVIDEIQDRDEEFANKLAAFAQSLETIEQLHVVVWPVDIAKSDSTEDELKVPRWLRSEVTLLIKTGDPETVRANVDFLRPFFSLDGNQESIENNEFQSRRAGTHSPLTILIHDHWLIVSPSADRASLFLDRFAKSTILDKSLIKKRTYQIALKEFERMSKPLVIGYVKPDKFPSVFGSRTENDLGVETDNLSELPVAGFGVSFLKREKAIMIKTFISCSLPESGLSLEWTARRPLSQPLPELDFDIETVSAEAWDPKALAKAKRQNFDRVHGEGSYEETLRKEFGNELSKIVDDRSCESFKIRFKGPDRIKQLLNFERVADWDVMKSFLEHSVKKSNSKKDTESIEHLIILDDSPKTDSTAIVYGPSPQNRRQHSRRLLKMAETMPRERRFFETFYKPALDKGMTLEEVINEYAVGYPGWVLTNEWLFEGSINRIFQQIDSPNDNSKEDRGFASINKKIELLSQKSRTSWPSHLRAGKGEAFIWKIQIIAWTVFRQKYSHKDKETVLAMWEEFSRFESEGRPQTLRLPNQLPASEYPQSDSDLHDFLGWHVFDMVVRQCDYLIECSPPKSLGEQIQEKVLGAFFNQP